MLERQIGAIIRLNRINQNISVRGLAEMVGIEYSQLSKIERGMEFSNTLTMESIFDALDLNYQYTLECIPKSSELILKLYHDIIYRKPHEKIIKQLNHLNKVGQKMGLNTSLLLINLIYNVLWQVPRDDYDKSILTLTKVEETMSLLQKQLFYQYRGFYKYLVGDTTTALEYLDKSKTYYTDNSSSAMIAYQKGLIYANHNDFIESFECLNEAKHLFELHHNYVRSAFCSLSIANIYLIIGKYEKANLLYNELIEVYDDFNLPISDKLIIYNNLLFLCILRERYEEFMDIFNSFEDKMKALLLKKPQYYYFQMVASYHLGNVDLCESSIRQFESLNEDSVDSYMAQYYRLKISGAKEEELIKVFSLNLSAMENGAITAHNRFILKSFLKEFKQSKNYKLLYQCALKLSELKM